ncbi:hypothetical protein RND81_08G202200 [Saponaria officinalis]|uniref:Uncharacterized protein n=1 Tax=Saponaria officinalis TaxID=3572 RepID=A0AAW1J972_SAPOF
MEISEKELEKRLFDAGNKLLSPPSSTPELLTFLNLVGNLLAVVEQSPTESMKEALAPLTKALIAEELLRHLDVDVKVSVAACISDITRITAPDAPYEDDPMKEVFQLIVSSFEKLDDTLSRSYTKRITILETVAKVRSCVVMLDLQCDDLIVEMFQHFFKTIRDDHYEGIFSSMETIMTLVVEESEDISVDLLSPILNVLKKEGQEVLPIARQLGEKVIVNCASKLRPYLLPAIRSTGASLNDYIKAVTDVYQTGDEAVEPIDGDAANKNGTTFRCNQADQNNLVDAPSEKAVEADGNNLVDAPSEKAAEADENNLVDTPSEKAAEVAMETLEDAPPSEEVGPSTAGSPKSIVSNGTLQTDNDYAVAANENSKEADLDTQGEKVESSKTVDDSEGSEEPPKYKPKQENSSRQKGQKPNSTKSSLELLYPAVSDRLTEDIKQEHQDDAVLTDDIRCDDTAEAADDEKSSGAPIPSPKTSDNECTGISSASPSVSLADETCSKKTERGENREDRIQESETVSSVDSEKGSDSKNKCDSQVKKEATVSESKLNMSPDKKTPLAPEPEEIVPDSAGDTKKEYDDMDELAGKSPQGLSHEEETEVGDSQLDVKKKPGQAKPTPAKSHKKKSAKDVKKKTVAVPKSAPKVTNYESDLEETLRSSSKRKRPSEGKESKTKVYGSELVGATVKVWWPVDKEFYQGVVDSFDPETKKHKILYDDGEIEILNLEEEKWQLINLSEGRANDGDGPDEVADETPKGKKAKTSTDLEAKRGKTVSSAKKSGASSSGSKATSKSGSKQDTAKIANKVKDETSKKGGKSDLDKSGKSAKVSKIGSKLINDTPKLTGKSKDDNMDSPKASTKSKPVTSKGASNSKSKTPKSVGKLSSGSSGKLKVGASTNHDDSDDESLESARTPEKPKGKSLSAMKSQKSPNKRKRSSKG